MYQQFKHASEQSCYYPFSLTPPFSPWGTPTFQDHKTSAGQCFLTGLRDGCHLLAGQTSPEPCIPLSHDSFLSCPKSAQFTPQSMAWMRQSAWIRCGTKAWETWKWCLLCSWSTLDMWTWSLDLGALYCSKSSPLASSLATGQRLWHLQVQVDTCSSAVPSPRSNPECPGL